MPDKTTGKVSVVSVAQRNENKHAVFARIHCKDEAGKLFYFDAACFNFDLNEEEVKCLNKKRST